jgi:hypothetical protein
VVYRSYQLETRRDEPILDSELAACANNDQRRQKREMDGNDGPSYIYIEGFSVDFLWAVSLSDNATAVLSTIITRLPLWDAYGRLPPSSPIPLSVLEVRGTGAPSHHPSIFLY